MKKHLRIVIADQSADFSRLLSDRIESEDDISVAGIAYDGAQAVELCVNEKPDVLVMDLLLRELDGIAVIRALQEKDMATRVIVVTSFVNDRVAARLSRLGVDWLMPKPCSLNELTARIRDVNAVSTYDFEADIAEVLLGYGLTAGNSGFTYSGVAVKQCIEDKGVLNGVTKVLYPEIGKRYGANSKSVERCIREAIDNAWKFGDVQARERYFGSFMQHLREKPTNKKFISLMAEFVIRKRSGFTDGEQSTTE
ncbi:MAG: response regulator [Oscillospiraceae bacterium]|nr:response regulator [Oscillospiraceae bacterium]